MTEDIRESLSYIRHSDKTHTYSAAKLLRSAVFVTQAYDESTAELRRITETLAQKAIQGTYEDKVLRESGERVEITANHLAHKIDQLENKINLLLSSVEEWEKLSVWEKIKKIVLDKNRNM